MKVAELGSISAAADLLELPKSTVSRRLARLEKELGQALVHRESDGSRLTEAGHGARRQGARVLAEVACLLGEGPRPPTVLQVAAPPEISYTPGFIRLLDQYRRRQPNVVCDVYTSTRRFDLVQDPIDLVFRLHLSPIRGPASLKTKTLGRLHGEVYASPKWAKANPIEHPQQLASVPVLTLPGGTLRTHWALEHAEEGSVQIPIQAGVFGSELPWLGVAAAGGHGPALLPPHIAAPKVQAKRLVRILPQWRTPPVRLSLLWMCQDPEPGGAPRADRHDTAASDAARGLSDQPNPIGQSARMAPPMVGPRVFVFCCCFKEASVSMVSAPWCAALVPASAVVPP